MKIIPQNQKTRKFQVGGAMPTDAPMELAPVESGTPAAPDLSLEQDPIMALAQIFMLGLLNQDCNLLAQGALMFLEIVQQMQGGAPEEPQGEPVYRRGGTLVRRIKK